MESPSVGGNVSVHSPSDLELNQFFARTFFAAASLLQTVLLVSVYANNEHERQKSRAQAFNIPMPPDVLRNVRGTRL